MLISVGKLKISCTQLGFLIDWEVAAILVLQVSDILIQHLSYELRVTMCPALGWAPGIQLGTWEI